MSAIVYISMGFTEEKYMKDVNLSIIAIYLDAPNHRTNNTVWEMIKQRKEKKNA